MPTPDAPDAPPPPTRQRVYRVIVIALAVASAVMLYLNWQLLRDMDRPAKRSPEAPQREPASPTTAVATQPIDPRDLFDHADATDAALHRAAGAEPLDHEPAHLPPPPTGERLWRFARKRQGFTEHIAAWRINADASGTNTPAQQAADFYRSAAQKRGYRPLHTDTATPRSTMLIFEKKPDRAGANRPPLLTVHLSERGGSVHAVIVLRYAMVADR